MRQTIWTLFLLGSSVAIMFVTQGCHRGYYRRMADTEAKQLVTEKSLDPRWSTQSGGIELDPASRMFNPFSEDHPPLPPDDPEAHRLMNRVDNRKGYPHWHANGDTDYVENPEWLDYLPRNENDEVIINFQTAVELSLLHSPTYQRQREELYLSALDVSLERFGFDSQMFSGFNSFFSTQGRLRAGGSQSNFSTGLGANGGGINYRKLGITGANFTVGLANSILWNFAGPNTQSASSLINFSIVQPFLRGGGRDLIMESLTQAERTLLANVRQMERFRQGFNLEITVGRNAGQGPARNGNFLGLPTSASTTAGGFMGLLQAKQNIRIQEFNVRQLEDVLEQFNEFFARDRLNKLQVLQTETTLFSAQQGLLQQKVNYQNQLDTFKRSLGLPPDLPIAIEDDFLGRFELISDPVLSKLRLISNLRTDAGDQINIVDSMLPDKNDEVSLKAHQYPAELGDAVNKLKPFLQEAIAITRDTLTTQKESIEADFAKLEEVIDERLEYLSVMRGRVERGELLGDVSPQVLSADSIKRPEQSRRELEVTLEQITLVEQRLNGIIERIDQVANDPRRTLPPLEFEGLAADQPAAVQQQLADRKAYVDAIDEGVLLAIADQFSRLNSLITEVSLIQALTRSNSIELPPIDIDERTAMQIARCFRLDWMNARTSLVDSWRQIEVVANQLQSQFDFVIDGSMGNFGDNPFKIRYETGTLRGGFRFDAPVTRLAERNQYRQALIRYQQAKRSYYQFEDEVSRNIRFTLRTIDLNKVLFELFRRNIRANIEQVESAKLAIDQPTRVGGGGGGGGGGAIGGGGGGGGGGGQLNNTAARDLTGAINTLQRAQSDFLEAWIRYEVLRRGLDYDLGTMQVDDRGFWVDPGKIDREIGYRVATQLGIDPSCLDCALPAEMQRFEKWLDQLPPETLKQLEQPETEPSPAVAPPLPPGKVPVSRQPGSQFQYE